MIDQYNKLIDSHVLFYDPSQEQALHHLFNLSQLLSSKVLSPQVPSLQTQANQTKSIVSTLFPKFWHKKKTKQPVKNLQGLYLHGRVGRGKTMLMDLFYQNLAIKKKQRIHFHRFMESIHLQLSQRSETKCKGDNPLEYIASQWASKTDLLCFDEFYVTDIGDAMLLSGLLKVFFEQGIVMVFTSNAAPEMLYRNGLQRERFLPTIDLINQYCDIVSVDGDIDHRLSKGSAPDTYHNYFLTKYQGEEKLKARFNKLCSLNKLHLAKEVVNKSALTPFLKSINHISKIVEINHRSIVYKQQIDNAIWFEFNELCSGPRSQRDYIVLADMFDVVFISDVPQFSGKLIPAVFSGVEDSYQRKGNLLSQLRHLDDEARRFIALVDEFYDRKVMLVISAEVDIFDLYQGSQLTFEFARCQSRLVEMQQNIKNTNG